MPEDAKSSVIDPAVRARRRACGRRLHDTKGLSSPTGGGMVTDDPPMSHDRAGEPGRAPRSARRRREALKRIEAAIDRLGRGDYGYCVRCGEPIGLERLIDDPACATCAGCVSKR